MKKIISLLCALCLAAFLAACGSREDKPINLDGQEDTNMNNQIQVTFNGKAYTATLVDNTSAQAFAAYLKEQGGSITVSASDYGGFEKVGTLGASLVTNDQRITTAPGDIILYQGNQITLYYAANSWSLTRLGRLDGDLSNLNADLGSGDVDITYSLAD